MQREEQELKGRNLVFRWCMLDVTRTNYEQPYVIRIRRPLVYKKADGNKHRNKWKHVRIQWRPVHPGPKAKEEISHKEYWKIQCQQGKHLKCMSRTTSNAKQENATKSIQKAPTQRADTKYTQKHTNHLHNALLAHVTDCTRHGKANNLSSIKAKPLRGDGKINARTHTNAAR